MSPRLANIVLGVAAMAAMSMAVAYYRFRRQSVAAKARYGQDFLALADSIQEACMVLTRADEDCRCVYLNAAALSLLRVEQAAVGAPLAALLPESAASALIEAANSALTEGSASVDCWVLTDARGVERWYRLHLVRQEDSVIVTALDISEHKYATHRASLLVSDAPNPMLMVDQSGRIQLANLQLGQMFGYSPAELIGQKLELLIPMRFHVTHGHHLKHFFSKPHTRPMAAGRDLFGVRKDGVEIPIEVGLNTIDMPDGSAVLASVVDISARKNTERQLAEANALMRSIIHSAPISIIATDPNGTIIAMSPAAESMVWYSQDELIGKHTPAIFHDASEIEQRARELSEELACEIAPGFDVFVAKAKRGINEEHEWTYVRKDGVRVPVQLTVAALRDSENALTGFLGIAYDITERKRADEYLRYLAHHDALTGLPNRVLLNDRLDVAIGRAQRFGGKVGLMMIDLDYFKKINDSLGHHIGDQLLIAVASKLTACVRNTDTVARMGGDEFILVLPDVSDSDEVTEIAQTIVAELSRPLVIDSYELRISASVGFCLFPDDGIDSTTLLKFADTAMYAAKTAGRGNFKAYAKNT